MTGALPQPDHEKCHRGTRQASDDRHAGKTVEQHQTHDEARPLHQARKLSQHRSKGVAITRLEHGIRQAADQAEENIVEQRQKGDPHVPGDGVGHRPEQRRRRHDDEQGAANDGHEQLSTLKDFVRRIDFTTSHGHGHDVSGDTRHADIGHAQISRQSRQEEPGPVDGSVPVGQENGKRQKLDEDRYDLTKGVGTDTQEHSSEHAGWILSLRPKPQLDDGGVGHTLGEVGAPLQRRGLMGCAGLPRYTVHAARSLNAQARAPTTQPSPTLTPGPTNASLAIQTSLPMVMGRARNWKVGSLVSCVPPHRKTRWEMIVRSPMMIRAML